MVKSFPWRLETVQKGVNFAIGQDTVPDTHFSSAGRWNRSGKDSIYYEDDDEYYDDWEEWEPDEDDVHGLTKEQLTMKMTMDVKRTLQPMRMQRPSMMRCWQAM